MPVIVGQRGALAGQITPFIESIPVTVDGQTLFTLSSAPASPTTVQMFVNGDAYLIDVDFSVSGADVTWNDIDFTMETDDTVFFVYDI